MHISRTTLIVGLGLAVLAGLIIFSGTGWHVPPTQGNSVSTTNSDATELGVAHLDDWKLYSNAEIGISFYYPPTWTVSELEAPRAIIVRSPDFEERDLSNTPVKMGESANPVLRGAQFSIPLDTNELQGDIQSPEAYVAFRMPHAQNSSNRIETREIIFAGRPAIFGRYKADYYGDGAGIETSHRGRSFYVGYGYDVFSPEKEEILNDFISGFRFL